LSLTSLQMWIVVPGMIVFLRHELLNHVTSCLPETNFSVHSWFEKGSEYAALTSSEVLLVI
jgi:hypothetical protein